MGLGSRETRSEAETPSQLAFTLELTGDNNHVRTPLLATAHIDRESSLPLN